MKARVRALAAFITYVAGYCALVGLYPAGGHDYFTHYFYFYQTVSIAPGYGRTASDINYYYSKGAGLYFLAMLLTDPLAPQLVTSCFMAAAALVIFLFATLRAGRRLALGWRHDISRRLHLHADLGPIREAA